MQIVSVINFMCPLTLPTTQRGERARSEFLPVASDSARLTTTTITSVVLACAGECKHIQKADTKYLLPFPKQRC